MSYRHFSKLVFRPCLNFADLFLLRMIPKDARFLLDRETFVRYLILTFWILKTNLRMYLVLTFEISLNFPPERHATDHYIICLKIVSNVFNDDFLVNISKKFHCFGNISCGGNLTGWENLLITWTFQTRLALYDNLCWPLYNSHDYRLYHRILGPGMLVKKRCKRLLPIVKLSAGESKFRHSISPTLTRMISPPVDFLMDFQILTN